MSTAQKFGGQWTKTKLGIFKGYLDAYLDVLTNRTFETIYIDAFAGSGSIELEYEVLDGSARIALSSPKHFDRYYFIDYRKENVASLRSMIHNDFPEIENRTTVIQGDANKEVIKLINVLNWETTRCLMFIDPFATEFKWDSLHRISGTEAIDLWYLFPYSAVNRMLTKNGKMNETWEKNLDEVFGSKDWRESFYHKSPQASLFGDDEMEKDSRIETMNEYLVGRLEMTFPGVAKKPYVFRNRMNSPLFLFCFAMSNPSERARAIGLRIANHLLNSKE